MRLGNFTSSEIFRLMAEGKKAGTFGVPALSYIDECNMERRLGRALENDQFARATQWGKICETHVFSLLGLEYAAISKEPIQHPDFSCWAGTPDTRYTDSARVVGDIKCPFTLKSFCKLVDAWTEGGIEAVREVHSDGEKFYWQLVSNACLTGSTEGELIVFAPYKSELQHIRDLSQTVDFISDNFMWLYFASESELPWLPDQGYYKNINKMRFAIPEKDKDALALRVSQASKNLVVPMQLIS